MIGLDCILMIPLPFCFVYICPRQNVSSSEFNPALSMHAVGPLSISSSVSSGCCCRLALHHSPPAVAVRSREAGSLGASNCQLHGQVEVIWQPEWVSPELMGSRRMEE